MRVGFNFPMKAKVILSVNWPLFQAHIYLHITALFNQAHICLNMCSCEIWAGSTQLVSDWLMHTFVF